MTRQPMRLTAATAAGTTSPSTWWVRTLTPCRSADPSAPPTATAAQITVPPWPDGPHGWYVALRPVVAVSSQEYILVRDYLAPPGVARLRDLVRPIAIVDATKTVEYVPLRMPISIVNANPRSASPPNR